VKDDYVKIKFTLTVTAGFYLFGFDWPEVYRKIRVPDRRGRPRRLPNNLIRGFEVMKKAVEKENKRKNELL